jgi:glutamyl/glutaminyl-tRNA synthetase
MVNSPMDREESIDYATYLVLREALTKGFVEMSLLGKFSRIPGFDKSAIGIMKGQIKDIAESAISNPVESKKQLELMETQLDMGRIESLYLPADIKDYVEMVVHAKIYRAFKEGIETDKGFIWKRILIPILEQRSDEIYGKRQVILNGFLDAPIGIYEKIYNKYVPLNPDKIEMLEKKLDDYGIPINFPHTPDDLMNVDIRTGIIEDTKDRVVVRFAPTPNGPLSIGHSRGVCLLGEYEKRYPGAKLLLRFDDTDPAKSTDLSEYGIPDVFQQIIDEMEWLLDIDIPKRNIIIASERFTLYQNEVIEAMRKGKAVCDTRRDGLVSGVDNNLSVFASMLKGEYAAGEAAVKLTASIPKGDLSKDYDNRAGEILFRMVEYNGENLCVPLMNLQSVVDDKKTGVTHIVRGADHDGGNLGRQKKIWSEMGYGQFPFVDNWGLVALTDDQEYNTYITSKEFDDKHDRIDTTLAEKAGKMGILTTRISTSRMRKGMNEGLYSENQFQSPELPTLTSLKHEHLYMENSKPITSEAIRAYWNIVRHNQDVTAIFNREELRQLNERMSKGGYVFEEKAYADEQERRDYIKGLKMQDRYYAEEDEESFDAEIMSSVEIENHSVGKYKNKHFLTDKELSDFLIKHGTNHDSFRKNKKAKGNIIISTPEGGFISEAKFAISKPDNWNDKDMLMIIPDDYLGIYQDDFDAENWGGDPEGPLAKALEKARKNAKKPKKPLKIERLDAESFAAEGRCPITGEPVARGKTYADGEVAKMANQTIKLFGGRRGGFRRSDVMKAVMALNDYGGELSATGWAERVNSNPKYRTTRELNASNVHRVLAFLKPDVYERKYTGYSMKAKYVYSIVKGDKLLDWLKPEFIPEEFKKK